MVSIMPKSKSKLPDLQKMILNSFWAKMIISILWDLIDAFKVFGAGLAYAAVGTTLAVLLWGTPGVMSVWEGAEATDTVDRFVPSVTITGLIATFLIKK